MVTIDVLLENELTNRKKVIKDVNWRNRYYLCENSSELKIAEFDEETPNIFGNKIKDDNTILLEFQDRQIIYLKNYLKALSSPKIYIINYRFL